MYSSIVVGTDGSPTATEAVAHAISLARATGATLHVVTVRKPEPALVGAPEVGVPPLDADYGGLDADATLEGARLVAESAGVPIRTHAVIGAAAGSLIEVARSVSADLLVVGSRGMQGARRLIGSVPNSVTHHAPCSVLVVHTC